MPAYPGSGGDPWREYPSMANVKINIDDVNSVFGWIMKAGTDVDALWDRVIPVMKTEVAREFSDENPNKWKALSPLYKKWKMEQGYPEIIGVRTGTLKRAATAGAIIVRSPERLEYTIDTGPAVQQEGFNYFSDFDEKRKIFKHTRNVMSKHYREAAQKWMDEGNSK